VLESLISEKRLLQAAILLVRSLKTINKQDMLDVGAVADLRAYLVGQESVRENLYILPCARFLTACIGVEGHPY
jgi:exocyst complex component 4